MFTLSAQVSLELCDSVNAAVRRAVAARTCCWLLSAVMAATSTAAHAGDGCIPAWSEQFAVWDFGGSFAVAAVDFDDDGPGPNNPALYFTGGFDDVGEVVANHIARWDGSSFSTLGMGLSAQAAALAVFDRDQEGPEPASLIVGGYFEVAGGSTALHIASWNGTTWSALGTGIDGYVYSLAVFDEDGDGPLLPALFVGGGFNDAGGMPAANVARWDGASWSAVGGGMDAGVVSLLVWDPDDAGPRPALLVAGGGFETAGGIAAARIAQWDGQAWEPLGAGMNDGVTALCSYDADGDGPALAELIVGGSFTIADGRPANSIAAWNGEGWSPLGSGLTGAVFFLDVLIATMTSFDVDSDGRDELLVGGDFSSAGNGKASIAVWDGASWSSLFPTEPSWTFLLAASTIGGAGESVLYASSVIAPGHIGRWDGTEFDVLGGGITNQVLAIAAVSESKSDSASEVLFVGGTPFQEVPGAENIARWDGLEWSALGAGLNNQVYALLAVDEDDNPRTAEIVYAGGAFTSSGEVTVRNVARWNGSAWSALGSGFTSSDSLVSALASYDRTGPGSGASSIIAGGTFLHVAGVPAANIASWDGASWSALGAGVDNSVRALAVFDEDGDGPLSAALFAGGAFMSAGGQLADRIARWDGAAWSEVGGGMNAFVLAMHVFDEDGTAPNPPALYVGGDFTVAGSTSARRVARWNGQTWSAVGAGLNGPVYALASVDLDGIGAEPRRLYAGGPFHGAGLEHLAEWDGQTWLPMGGGTDLTVNALAAVEDFAPDAARQALFAGGVFKLAGGLPSSRIARWGCDPAASPSCAADQNEDGVVDGFDLAQLLASWGKCLIPAGCEADLTDDGVVNGTDLALLLGAWGPC